MHIRPIKRKKGTVYKAVVKVNGKKTSKNFRRRFDAESWAKTTESFFRGEGRLGVTFRQVANEWLENHAKIRKAPSSFISDSNLLKFILPIIGNEPIQDISTRDIDVVVSVLKRDGRKKNTTINHYLQVIRTVLNYAVRNNDLLRNPITRAHFLPEHEVAFRYWQKAEAEKFIAHVEKKYRHENRFVYLLYMIALNTGMRWSEIIALKWDCIHFAGKPHIVVKWAFCIKSRQMRETTKGHKIRYVGLNEALLTALQEAEVARTPGAEFVFHTAAGTHLYISNFYQRHFLTDVVEAGVPKIRFHDLRHTFASLFMMENGNLYDLRNILGHSDVQMTMRYAHLAKEHILSKADVVVIGRRDNIISVDFSPSQQARS